MNKKLTLTLGTVAAIAAPVLAVVSCGDDATNNTGGNLGVNHNTSTLSERPGNNGSNKVTIQAEAGWQSTYATIIAGFKQSHADLLTKNGITDIETIEVGSFNTVENIKTKNQFDETFVADIFLVASDGMNDALSTKALQPYNLTRFATTPTKMSETPAAEFMKLHGNGDSFLDKAFATAMTGVRTIGSKRGNTYGLPANVESMIAFNKQGATNTHLLTQFANLWMSAGFFNTATKNMKDIVSTNPANGKIVAPNVTEWTPFIKAGFKKIATKIKALQDVAGKFDQDMLDKTATTSEPAIENYVTQHKNDVTLLDGPWNAGKMTNLFGTYEAKPAPSDWNQWGGGWNMCLNSRMTGAEQTVAEEFIAYLLNHQNAEALFTGAGKISPTTQGKTELTSQTFMATNTIPDAVYKTTVQEKPTDAAFGNVGWTSYAETVHEFRKEDGTTPRGWSLSDLTSQSDLDAVATAMTNTYFAKLNTTITAKNNASTS